MTLIICKGNVLAGDLKTTGGYNLNDIQEKIIRVGGNIIGIAGDTLPIKLIESVYKIFLEREGDLYNELMCIKFKKMLEEFSGIKDIHISLIILNKDLKLSIGSNSHIEYEKNGLLCIGSGHISAVALQDYANKNKINLELEDYFDIASSLDDGVSKAFITLSL